MSSINPENPTVEVHEVRGRVILSPMSPSYVQAVEQLAARRAIQSHYNSVAGQDPSLAFELQAAQDETMIRSGRLPLGMLDAIIVVEKIGDELLEPPIEAHARIALEGVGSKLYVNPNIYDDQHNTDPRQEMLMDIGFENKTYAIDPKSDEFTGLIPAPNSEEPFERAQESAITITGQSYSDAFHHAFRLIVGMPSED